MKTACLLALFITGILFQCKGFGNLESVPAFYIYNTQKNPGLKDGKAEIRLHFNSPNFRDIPPGYNLIIYYSVNDSEDTLVLNPGFTCTISIKAGKTVFKFWPGPGYNEVITDTILIANQTTNEAQATFYPENTMIIVDKPVIYLQSPVTREFSLIVNPAGPFSFTYPVYKDQWKGTVHPSGIIDINGKKYPYLFWDSKQSFKLEKQQNGYHIFKTEVIPFLEKQLSNAGLTAAETTDFITYWGPRLTKYESVFIQFYLQKDCDRFATIQCEPQPEAVNRLYIGFSEWKNEFENYLLPFNLPAFKRDGFNLLEWGGFELKPVEL